MDDGGRIVNFGGNVSFTPRHRYAPGSEAEVLEIGVLSGTTLPVLGMGVRKSGRTTGLTSGTHG